MPPRMTTVFKSGPIFDPQWPAEFTNDNPSIVLQDRTRSPSTNLRHCYENHTGSHSRTRVLLDNGGEYESSKIGGNSILHTRKSLERVICVKLRVIHE